MTETMPDANQSASGPSFPVVGVGASAGGLVAVGRLLETVSRSPGMAFVVVLHLSPKHESNAAAILQRATAMPVTQVIQQTHIEPNNVYVIPPGRSLSMVDGMLCLSDEERRKGGHVVIDHFFRTLAGAHRERAMAIVLTGTGADGAVGIAEVKEQGGVVLAQSPEDAEYDGMPTSAIATGMVDIVLPVVEIGPRLIDLWRNAQAIELPATGGDELPVHTPSSPEAAEKALARIMALLHAGTGHDFRHYKRATVLRRIERRLQVASLPHLPAYVEYLQQEPQELPLLLADMLIGVTNFFRDREAFEAIEREVIPQLFTDQTQGEPVRVWVPGCSSGEEAYSLAMLLAQEAATTGVGRSLQVFATDIDNRAIARAREALYPASVVNDIPPALLRRYLLKEGLRYRVTKSVRDTVLCAAHNLLRDPPFSRLNMVSCRNLLIYLERDVQADILQMFHFALRPGGFLFLGSSETADVSGHLFTMVDKRHRIYRANAVVRPPRGLPRFPLGGHAPSEPALATRVRTERHEANAIGELHLRLLQAYAPPSIVIDSEGSILHVAGAEHYLRFSAGAPTQHLLSLVHADLRPAVRAAMFEASQNGAPASASVRLTIEGRERQVTVAVRTVRTADWPAEIRLLLFYDMEAQATDSLPLGPPSADGLVTRLEAELERKEQQLQQGIERYEVSVENLKASNEELQAINEELRSATEELETSKEELQSTNEELTTVNHELKCKVDETAETNDDLQNLIASTGIATIFLERDMRIKRFTPMASELFNIIPADIGRSLMDITHRLDYDGLAEDAAETFNALRSVEREVRSHDGRIFLARFLPYRTGEDRIGGAVLSFIDVTALRSAERNMHLDQERMQLIAQSMPGLAIMTMDATGCFTSWSVGAMQLFGYEEAEVIGEPFEMIFTPEDRQAGVPQQELSSARRLGQGIDERWHQRKDGSRVFVSGFTAPMRLGRLDGYAKIAQDLTSLKRSVDKDREVFASAMVSAERAVASNDMKDEFLAVMSHELKHPLSLIQVNAQMLSAMPEAQPHPRLLKVASSIQASVKAQARIIDDLLDLSRTRQGKLALNIAPVYLRETLQGSFDWAAREAAARELDFQLVFEDDDALLVEVDPVRIQQVVMNLLSNALKFTPAGGRIVVEMGRVGDEAMVRVVDNGRGIPAHFLPHVFGLFRQVNTPTTRQEGGLGIGLALVDGIVRLHGGRVSAGSKGEGKGATFTVYLPLKEVSGFAPLADDQAHVPLRGLRVLVVEDSRDLLESFCALLQLEGADVTPAPSGERALEAAEQQDFDLVLSDIGMPLMDGYMFLRALRQRPRFAKVPAIALTGFGSAEDAAHSVEAGFDAHLSKPVDIRRLQALVAELGVQPRQGR